MPKRRGTGAPFADGVTERLKAKVQVVKRNELHTFAVLPKRWIVERRFGWLEKCRRLWKNCERQLNTSLQLAPLASLVLPRRDRKQAHRPRDLRHRLVFAFGAPMNEVVIEDP